MFIFLFFVHTYNVINISGWTRKLFSYFAQSITQREYKMARFDSK